MLEVGLVGMRTEVGELVFAVHIDRVVVLAEPMCLDMPGGSGELVVLVKPTRVGLLDRAGVLEVLERLLLVGTFVLGVAVWPG